MRLVKKNESEDGYIWECRKRGENAHRNRRSMQKNIWFAESKLSILEILLVTNMWMKIANRVSIAFEIGVARSSVTEWMSFCREVCFDMCDFESSILGGLGDIVEIDESMFGKRKFNRGNRVNGSWVFGGVQRGL
ncbi:putative transposase-like protein [Nephila pilipes]|uniref:Putative transposase-like protein n=1 Tax=Nephila pilipes TaxID=299642 RepID=A0A8X6QHX1_NEPPI|nr:putative transposase-like protein [Nephila pilipes]GFS69096.1 putative transposase-like protein [Nephila pilipes]GFT10975.1 putative transposase-like protein [Nephila pilipes]GFU23047.1 putative transposase-like protein [Nephila pilipes]